MWTEALNTAVYLRNKSATKSLDRMTPIEAWSKKKPYVDHLKTMESKAIVLNKGEKEENSNQKMTNTYIHIYIYWWAALRNRKLSPLEARYQNYC